MVASDHLGVRAGLRPLLERHPACTMVGEAATAPQALALTVRLLPDVLLLDLAQSVTDRLALIRRVRTAVPTTGVVVLTMFADATAMQALVQVGAAVVLKQAPTSALVSAIEQASAGHH